MRLRSHQFVFLLLLACCVRVEGGCAARLLQGDLCGSGPVAFATRETAQPALRQAGGFGSLRPLPATTLNLDPASAASHRVVWPVRRAVLECSAVSSFTGFLRA
jgi:hypothetical protein